MMKRLALVAAVVVCWSTVAGATSLNLPRQATPDIFSNSILVSYVAPTGGGTGTLTATGYAREINLPPTKDIYDELTPGSGRGSFELSVRVDTAGNLQPFNASLGDKFEITGSADLNNDGTIDTTSPSGSGREAGTLLAGTVQQFGFATADDPLEFVFSVTGGEAADLYGGIGFLGGITLSKWVRGSWGGDFSTSFNNAFLPGLGVGLSDTYVVPEPVTALMAIPLCFLARLARRRAGRAP